MTQVGRTDRRNAKTLRCVHCNEVWLVDEMAPLSCGLPSDCCNECWQKFLKQNPWFRDKDRNVNVAT